MALAVLALAGCTQQRLDINLQLAPTPVLTVRTERAVVTTESLRIREAPSQNAPIVSYLRQGAVVEVLSQTDTLVEVESERAFWFQISYEGVRGWVFGAYLAPVGPGGIPRSDADPP